MATKEPTATPMKPIIPEFYLSRKALKKGRVYNHFLNHC